MFQENRSLTLLKDLEGCELSGSQGLTSARFPWGGIGHGGRILNPQPQSVLIVDPMEETRAVLRTALAQRGLQIWEASRVRQGADLAREHHPDLIVFDLENSGDSNRPLDSEWLTSSDDSTPAVVFLGTARLNEPKPRGGEFVQKPYHYGPLIRKIEELLAKCRETA